MKQRSIPLLLLVSALVPVTTVAGQTPTPFLKAPRTDVRAQWSAWRETMRGIPKPNDRGCFTASYPETIWRENPCQAPPTTPYPPASAFQTDRSVAGPYTVGNGTDYSASVTGTLSSAVGSFPVVSGLSSANAYSLQVNSQFFVSSLCSGAAVPSVCRGWQQFVYSVSPSEVFMQYWLVNYGNVSCPSGWLSFTTQPPDSETSCYKSSSATSATVPQIANWGSLELKGASASGTDEVTFYDGGGNVSATGSDSVLSLESKWDEAEFNVFGNGNGTKVSFNAGTTFVIQTNVVNGSTTAPSCSSAGFTLETNNLSGVGSCCPYAGSGSVTPKIQFLESNTSVATASCGTSALQTNPTAVPQSSGTYVSSGGEYPNVTFTETLTDTTSGAQIYWQVPGCSGSTSGGNPLSSGGEFNLYYSSEYDCNPSGTMYATSPTTIASPVVSIDFP